MKPHTTHFDDCGCLTARLAAAEAREMALREAYAGAVQAIDDALGYRPDASCAYAVLRTEMAKAVLAGNFLSAPPGDRSALRAIVVASVNATVDHFGEDNLEIPCLATERGTGCLGRTQAEVAACYARDREQLVDAIVARIMGEGEEA